MTKKQIKEKLTELHARENILNAEMGMIDKINRENAKRKGKLTKAISKNMKYRNLLISKL